MESKTILVLLDRGLFAEGLIDLVAELDGDYRAVVDSGKTLLGIGASDADGVSLVLFDVDRLGDDPAAVIERLQSRMPGLRLVGFGSHTDRARVDRVMDAGLAGYIPKDYGRAETLIALTLVLGGDDYRPGARPFGGTRIMRDARPGKFRKAEDFGLTKAESVVLSLLARGKTNREIALARGTKPSTVRVQLTPVFRKLGVQSRGQAIVVALRHGLVEEAPNRTAADAPLDLAWLLPHMKYRRHPRGHVIFRKGDVGTEMFLIQRGRVSISEVEVELEEHDVFGEISVFAPDHRRTQSATCSTEVDLWALPEHKAKQLCITDPTFALRMLSLVATRLSSERQQAA